MSDLKLDSLRIQNFRTFKDLTIDRLGRVNLIVGKNNVGKTALLEGIWLWDHPEYWQDLAEFLEDDFPDDGQEPKRRVLSRRYQVLRTLFHGYPDFQNVNDCDISVGPSSEDDLTADIEVGVQERRNIFYLEIEIGHHEEENFSEIVISNPDESYIGYESVRSRVNFVASDGIHLEDAGRFWDKSVRSNLKEHVLDAVKVVVPNLEDVNWVNEPFLDTVISGSSLRRGAGSTDRREPLVTLSEFEEAIPLSSLGEGAERALWIGTSIVNSNGGILLVDEIENGLHYSIQPDLWRMIFETARELDVQVFATTHSHDCVQAFQQVSGEHEEEGMLISLRRKRSDPEEIVAVPIEEEELEYAVETHTDVR